MTLDEIKNFFQMHRDPNEWARVDSFDGSEIFLKVDVNLRVCSAIRWQSGKPYFVVQAYYASTLLLFVPILIGPAIADLLNVDELLRVAQAGFDAI